MLGLSGGIACYKAAELTRALASAGAEVQVVMTEAAEHFITATTMQALSNRSVYTSQWDAREPNSMAHINLTRAADLVLVAPASADFIAKLVHGRADDLLSLLCLARPIERCPLLLAPAMNREMWAHPATQRNVAQVRADGATILGPASGDQACGEIGDGRMLEPEELLDDVIAFLQPKALHRQARADHRGADLRADRPGARHHQPFERQDGFRDRARGVRGWRTRSRWWPGRCICPPRAACSASTCARRSRCTTRCCRSHRRMTCSSRPRRSPIGARPRCPSARSRRTATSSRRRFELVENADILAAVAGLPDRPYCVGFAAESHDLLKHARDKLQRKRLPLIVGNLGPSTFGRDDNALLIVDENGHRELPADGGTADKLTLARALVQEIASRISTHRT